MRLKRMVWMLMLVAAAAVGRPAAGAGEPAVAANEDTWLAVLKSDADLQRKGEACRELGRVGTERAVPALAALLADEKLSHMARYGLEPIPSPAVDEALRAALGRLHGTLLAGVADSVGKRRDTKAVDALVSLLKSDDAVVAAAAARALGRIAVPAAVQGLQSALAGATGAQRLVLCDGLLGCAESLAAHGERAAASSVYEALRGLPQLPPTVRVAAWRGAILTGSKGGQPLLRQAIRSTDNDLVQMAAQVAMELPGKATTKTLARELAQLPADQQILFARVLGKRRDATALPALVELSKQGPKPARLAAVSAMTEVGPAAVAPLAELLSDPESEVAEAASSGLASLPGAAVDEVVLKLLHSRNRALRLKMLDMAGQRRLAQARPAFLKSMQDADGAVRVAAIRNLGAVAGMTELAPLLESLDRLTQTEEREALEKVLGSICAKAENPAAAAQPLAAALAKASPAVKPILLNTLRVVGGPAALQAVQGAVGDTDTAIHAAALRVLCGWKTVDAGPALLALAKDSRTAEDRLLSLRGYLGLASRSAVPAQERLALCRAAAPLIQRAEEKQLLLGSLSEIAAVESLDLIVPCLDEPAVKGEAVAAVMAIAEKHGAQPPAGALRSALEKVIQAAADKPDVVRRAQELVQPKGGVR